MLWGVMSLFLVWTVTNIVLLTKLYGNQRLHDHRIGVVEAEVSADRLSSREIMRDLDEAQTKWRHTIVTEVIAPMQETTYKAAGSVDTLVKLFASRRVGD